MAQNGVLMEFNDTRVSVGVREREEDVVIIT